MKKINKLVALLPIFAFSVSFSSCSSNNNKNKTDFKIRMHYTGVISDSPTTKYFNVHFDVNDFVNLSEKPTMELANFALVIAFNTASGQCFEVKNGKYKIDGEDDYISLYKEFGLEGIERNYVVYEEEPRDLPTYIFAHKEFIYLDKEYDLVICNYIEHCMNTHWPSDFDVGADTEDYYRITGEHPLWVDKNNHKGFDIGARRDKEELDKYLSKLDSNKERIVFSTGHSRGGAMASMVTKMLVDEGVNAHAYCFSNPNTTTSIDKEYKTIHNFLNESDIITRLPSEKWGFNRYGTTYSADVNDYTDEFLEFNNYPFTKNDISGLADLLDNVIKDRSDLYSLDEKYVLAQKTFDSLEAANKEITKYNNAFTGQLDSLNHYVQTKLEENDGTYHTLFYTCPAFLCEVAAIALSIFNTSKIINLFLPILSYLQSFMTSLQQEGQSIDPMGMMSNIESFYSAHIFSAYYIVLNYGIKL